MIYWHVERNSVCIYSQLKSCSSSEVAAMIEGVLRHDTEMEIEKDYVDTHGQSEVGFAFCYLLTSQHDSTNASYVRPVGLEVLLPPTPDAALSVTLKSRNGQVSDAELKQHARGDRPVVLQADGTAPFGDVVHAVDVYRGEGAKVFLATGAK